MTDNDDVKEMWKTISDRLKNYEVVNVMGMDNALKQAIERNTDLEAKRLLQEYNIPCFDGGNIQDIVLAMKKVNSDLNWKEDFGDRIVYCYLLDGVVGIDFANQFHEYLEQMGAEDEV